MSYPNISVLLIEDDRDLAASISEFLSLEKISCDHAYNGLSGFELALSNHYDVVLLDVTLPKLDGLAVCETLRRESIDTPIMMLTARDTLEDKLAGFRSGSDDYMVKPFALEELVARILSLKNRRSGQVRTLQVGALTLNLDTNVAYCQGKPLKLTPSGLKLLEVLLRESPKVVSRKELEKALWQDDLPTSNNLKVHMYHLRQAINKPFDEDLIQTVKNQGFQIKASYA